MDDAAAVESLKRFGLTTYEARAFVALQKLGTATASEVSDVAEVPRSQVYGAAEGLEERGLIDVEQTTPTRYRPVAPAEARARLLAELERDSDRAFEYLERIEGCHDEREQRSEAVWTVEGSDAIAARVVDIVAAAEDRVVYGVDAPDLLEPAVVDALRERAADGLLVVAATDDPDVYERLDAIEGVSAHHNPAEQTPGTGRLVVADRDGVLLSVVGAGQGPARDRETAIWSADTTFATVFVTMVEEWLEANLPDVRT